MKIRIPLSDSVEARLTLVQADHRHYLTKRIKTDEFDILISKLEDLRVPVTGEDLPEPSEEPAAYGDYVMLPAHVLRYAATALEGSADRGDRYAASQIRDALNEPHATYEADA